MMPWYRASGANIFDFVVIFLAVIAGCLRPVLAITARKITTMP